MLLWATGWGRKGMDKEDKVTHNYIIEMHSGGILKAF